MRSGWIFGLAVLAVALVGCDQKDAPILQSIAVAPASVVLLVNGSQQLSATGSFSDGSTSSITSQVTWSSADTTVATITAAGKVTALKVGFTTLKVLDPTSKISATANLLVTDSSLTAILVTPATSQIPLGAQQQFSASAVYADKVTHDMTSTVAWSSSDPTTVSIDASGMAHALKTGIVTISVTDSTTQMTGSASLSVSQAALQSISVSLKNAQVPAGVGDQAIALGNYTDGTSRDISSAVIWSSADASSATVSNAAGSQGAISTLKANSVAIQAQDSASGVSGSVNLQITAANLVSIQISPKSAQIPAGGSQQYSAMGTYSDQSSMDITSTITWASSNPSVASITAQGLAKGSQNGIITISATDPSSQVSAQATLSVTNSALVSIAVSLNQASVPVGISDQAVAIGTYTDGSVLNITSSVLWTSTNASTVASVSTNASSEGAITTLGAGSSTIEAQDIASGISGSATLTVTSDVLISIQITPEASEINVGGSIHLVATAVYSDQKVIATTFQWSTPDTSIVQGDGQGGFTGLAQGLATITATDLTSGLSATATIAVANLALTSVSIQTSLPAIPNGYAMVVSSSSQLQAIGTYSDGTTADISSEVNWASSDPSTVTVSNQGLAQGLIVSGNNPITITLNAPGVSPSTLLIDVIPMATIEATFIPDQTTNLGLVFALNLSPYFTDSQGNPLEFLVNPGDGTVPQLALSGTFTYVYRSSGAFPVTVTATDPLTGAQVTLVFNLFVEASPPIGIPIPMQTVYAGVPTVLVTIGGYFESPSPSDPLIYSVVSSISELGISYVNELSIDPVTGNLTLGTLTVGLYSTTVMAEDSVTGLSVSESFIINVGPNPIIILPPPPPGGSGITATLPPPSTTTVNAQSQIFASLPSGSSPSSLPSISVGQTLSSDPNGISYYDVNSTLAGATGTASVTLSYSGSTPPTLYYFNLATQTWQQFQSSTANSIVVDSLNHTITIYFDSTSQPALSSLTG
jgi:hypothetical protein